MEIVLSRTSAVVLAVGKVPIVMSQFVLITAPTEASASIPVSANARKVGSATVVIPQPSLQLWNVCIYAAIMEAALVVFASVSPNGPAVIAMLEFARMVAATTGIVRSTASAAVLEVGREKLVISHIVRRIAVGLVSACFLVFANALRSSTGRLARSASASSTDPESATTAASVFMVSVSVKMDGLETTAVFLLVQRVALSVEIALSLVFANVRNHSMAQLAGTSSARMTALDMESVTIKR